MEVKIMNYNILHGFYQTAYPFELEKNRLEKAKQIVKKENPDILILTEACYGGKNIFGIFMDYKKIFNYKYGYFGKWGEFEWGNMILSKYPIQAKTVGLADRTAIRSEIKIKEKTIHVDVIHPSPDLNEKEKIETIKPLLKNIKEQYILSGDFNSLSDEDKYDKDRLIKGFKTFTKNAEKIINEMLKDGFIRYLRKMGLKDAFPKNKRQSTIPTKKYRTGNSDVRIDHFFVSEKIKVEDARVIKNELTENASDHYPIVGIFNI